MTRTQLRAAGTAVLALTVLALGPVSVAAARPTQDAPPALDPGLARMLDGLAPGDTTTVLVTLRGETDPAPPAGLARSARPPAVVARLQAHARAAQAGLTARLTALARSGAVNRQEPLWVTNAVSVTATPAVVREVAARTDVASVQPDTLAVTPAAAAPEPNIVQTGATDLWAAGATGQGVVVADLDSGVDLSHADLASRWRGGGNSWFDPYGQHTSPVDLSGHGTATTSVLVGGDATSAYGMAPGATWIAARVFNDKGSSTRTAMHQAFQWLLDPDHDPATADTPDVVNASWVLGTGPSCDLSLQPDVRALRAAGILPVFAAGNFGPGSGTSASPANYPESLSVGAVGATDVVWAYTSAGPSACGGRTRVFPDVVAPGVSVLAADLYGGMQRLTGTSVAAPHAAGGLALLLGEHPGATPEAVLTALTSTAVDLGATGADDRYGNGRLDLRAADALLDAAPPPPAPADFSVTATPSSLSVARGSTGRVTVSTSAVSGTPGPATLSVTGLPAGVTAAWTANPVAVPGSSDLVVSVTTKARKGSYGLVLTAAGDGLVRTASVSLVVR
jgi:subtilisin family serine protease